MNVTIAAGARSGSVRIPSSKSQAHRLLILAALGKRPTALQIRGISEDIAATIRCLNALGAKIRQDGEIVFVTPIETVCSPCELPCGESGSTLRFLLPVVAALGAEAAFLRKGRLPERPLAPLDGELKKHGVRLAEDGEKLLVSGQLQPGAYRLPGNVSSQFFTGLLLALPLLSAESTLEIEGTLESAPYVEMTEQALALANISVSKKEKTYQIPGNQSAFLPEKCAVEGDWSNAAFFLCAGALSQKGVTVHGLRMDSAQGDRAVLDVLRAMGAEVTSSEDAVTVRRKMLRAVQIDASAIPDLIPVLAAAASAAEGETKIYNAARLRLKESDRLKTTAAMLTSLGADVTELTDGLIVRGKESLSGGTAEAFGDHRIAMSAAVASSVCREAVTICGSESVNKSYPQFWADFAALKGGSL